MTTFANVIPIASKDGVAYCTGAVVPSTELDLGVPVPLLYDQAFSAIVELSITGGPSSNLTWVVAQTDLGDGDWIDVAWLTFTALSGNAVFVISSGDVGSNAWQTRQPGSPPSPPTGGNAMVLGGMLRFVGMAELAGGANPQVLVTVRYKLLGLR